MYSNTLLGDYVDLEVMSVKSKRPDINTHKEFHQMYWVPIIFSIVYFILLGLLWTQARWFREANIALSPFFTSVLWLFVFIAIISTWIKCLQLADTRGHVALITCFFIINMLLLLAVGWAFFIGKNVAVASIFMLFLWIFTLVLVLISARFWPPGIALMIAYLIIVSFVWFRLGRIAYAMVTARNKVVAIGLAKAMGVGSGQGLTNLFLNMKSYFKMDKSATLAQPSNELPKQPIPNSSDDLIQSIHQRRDERQRRRAGETGNVGAHATKSTPPPAAEALRFLDERLETSVANDASPVGMWRSRGLSEDV